MSSRSKDRACQGVEYLKQGKVLGKWLRQWCLLFYALALDINLQLWRHTLLNIITWKNRYLTTRGRCHLRLYIFKRNNGPCELIITEKGKRNFKQRNVRVTQQSNPLFSSDDALCLERKTQQILCLILCECENEHSFTLLLRRQSVKPQPEGRCRSAFNAVYKMTI